MTSVEAIRQLLADWDIQITERMLSQIDAAKAKRSELERRKRELEENKSGKNLLLLLLYGFGLITLQTQSVMSLTFSS